MEGTVPEHPAIAITIRAMRETTSNLLIHLLPARRDDVTHVYLRSVRGLLAAFIFSIPGTLSAQDTPPGPYTQRIPGTVVEFDMIPLPGGQLERPGAVGSAAAEVGPFWLGTTEVTWDLYDLFVFGTGSGVEGADVGVSRPSRPYVLPGDSFGHSGNPALGMTFMAAEYFVQWLSDVTGHAYRLPTEAEWEYACRAGGAESGNLETLAWHRDNAGRKTHRVASLAPDALGFYDLLGNAGEWVTTEDGDGAVKGGAYSDPSDLMKCATRREYDPVWQMRDPQLPKSQWWLSDAPFVGLRVARDP